MLEVGIGIKIDEEEYGVTILENTAMRITMVKKLMADGFYCQKCIDVQERLEKSGYISQIDHFADYVENDAGSEGALLADYYQIDKAPFFIVEEKGKDAKIYTIYFKLVKDILEKTAA